MTLKIKRNTLISMMICILMTVFLSLWIPSGASAATEYTLEIVGTPTVYVQSGGEAYVSMKVKNQSKSTVKGVNMVTRSYYGELGGPEVLGTSVFDSTNPLGGATASYYRFQPWFEKKGYPAEGAVWSSDEEGYTIAAGATASLWFKLQSHYEAPGTYNEWIQFTDTHTELMYGLISRDVIDRNLSDQCPVKVVVYNPANAALTVGTSKNHATDITPVALGRAIDFGTVNLASTTGLVSEKEIYTRNTSNHNNYSAKDEHGLSTDIKVDFFVEKEDGERLYNADLTPFGWNSHLMSGMSWGPLPAASMDASEFQSVVTGITLDATDYVAGTYNVNLVLTTTPHGVKVNGSAIHTNGIYRWPAKVTLTGTNPRIPKAPKSLTAAAGNGQVELTFSPPQGAEENTSYYVYRRMGKESAANKENLSNAAFDWENYSCVGVTYAKNDGSCFFVDGTVTNGKTYTYVVSCGEPRKAYPAISGAVTPKADINSRIQAVGDLFPSSMENGVLLEWEMNANYGGTENDGSSMVDHFNIYRDGRLIAAVAQNAVIDEVYTSGEWSEGGEWIQTTTHSYSWSSFQETPNPGQTYTWNVVPVSKSGIEGYPAEDVYCAGRSSSISIASHIATYSADSGFSFEVIVNEGDWTLAGAKYWRTEGTGAPDTSKQPKITSEVSNVNGYTRALFEDTSITKGKTYTYTARLFDEGGVETPDYTFTVKAGGPSGSTYVSYSSLDVDWMVIGGTKASMSWYCDYYYNSEGDLVYYGTYTVKRKKGNGSWATIKTLSATSSGDRLKFTDDPGSDGTYTYRVDKTVNGLTMTGKTYIFERNTTAVDESTLPKAPDTPLFRIRLSDGKPILYWAPAETGDAPKGYRIYRRDAGKLLNGERYYTPAPWIAPRWTKWDNESYIIIDDPSAGSLVDEDGNYRDDALNGRLERVDWDDYACPHEYWIVAYNDVGISEPSEIVTLTNQGYDEYDYPIPPTNEDEYAPAKPVIDDIWVEWEDTSVSSGAWDNAIGGYLHAAWTDPESSLLSISSWQMDVTGLESEDYDTLYSWQAVKDPSAKLGTGADSPRVYVSAGFDGMDDYGRTAVVTITAKNDAGATTSEERSITIRSFPRFRTAEGNSRVKLEWTDLFEDPDTEVTGWEIWRRGETGPWKKLRETGILTPNESGTEYGGNPISYYSWYDEDVLNGWNYDYKVIAKCTDGIDRPSMVVGASPKATAASEAPGAPRNLTAKVINGEVQFSFDPPLAGTAQYYQLAYEATIGDTTYWMSATQVNAPSTSIIWQTSTPGTYQAFVYAYSYINGEKVPQGAPVWDDEASFDEKYPSHSNIVTFTISESQIAQQSQDYPDVFTLTATPGEGKIKLDWTASKGATYYVVKRITDDEVLEVTLPAGTRTYTDSTAMPGVLYTYDVYAYNIAGSIYNRVTARATGKSKDDIILEAVTDLIKDLPKADEILPENAADVEAEVRAAKEEYDRLTEEQKKKLPADTVEKLTDALDKLEFIRLNEQYAEVVAPVQETINALPAPNEITLDNLEAMQAAIAAARADYDAITPASAKKLVNTNSLTEAEAKISALLQYLEDRAVADTVEEELQQLPAADTITEENADDMAAVIQQARAAYEALTEDQKAMVDKDLLDKLSAAEAAVRKLTVKDLADAEITVPDATYSGKALMPEVTVEYNGTALTLNTDYTVTYENNIDVGIARVTISGIGDYTGDISKEFKINAAKPKWIRKSGKWYYSLGNGKNAKGWLKVGGVWYYFKSDYSMAANEWCEGYWLNKDGSWTYKAKAGWKKDKKGWYFQDTGKWYAKNSWQLIDDKWYYFKADGYMAANEWCKGYWLNKNGTWTYKYKASWKKDGKGWWYGDTSGWYAKNCWQLIDGKWYYFDARGYIITGTKTINGKTYSFASNGVCLNP